MNENMLAAHRNLGVRAALTLPTGAVLELGGDDILSFTVEEGADSALLPGAVLSARLTMSLADEAGGRRGQPFVGATAQVYLLCGGEALPCGVFVIDSVSAKERSGAITLSGSDSIASELSGAFADGLSYPAPLEDVWAQLIGQTRYEWSGTVPGGSAVISERPDWGEVTLRRAAGWIAQATGCFVRAGRTGQIELAPCAGGEAKTLGPETYLTLDDGFESFGPVAGIRVQPKEGETFTVTDGAGELLTVAGNPLLTEETTAQSMLSQLKGLSLQKASFRWRGDPSVGVGSRIALTDTYGTKRVCTVTRQTLRFDRGFSADCICAVPDAGPGGVARAITPEGGVNADALVGTVNGGLLRAGSVEARSIAAGTITAEKLAAGSVMADHLDADTVSARTAQFVAAELEKLTADDVQIDRLYAAAAHIVSLAAGSITAGSLSADRLSAALAEFVSMYAGAGEFDFATVQNLVARAMALQQGSMDTVYIRNLAVTQANLLSATLGKLVIRGDDGKYYRVFVGSDGTISTEEVQPSEDEIGAGETSEGRQIVESTMNVGSLNAERLQASSAVINQILTQALTAEKITAADALIASATIPELYATTIRAIGESLEIVNGRTNVIHRGETPPSDAGANDLWVQPSTGFFYQLADVSGLPDFYIDDGGVLYYAYGEDQTVYALTMDENGDLYADEAAPFAMAIDPDGRVIAWERVADSELKAGVEGNSALIREQSAKITEMADAIDLRVTTEVYEEDLDGLRTAIQKNEASITLLDDSITSRVSEEVTDQTGEIRGSVSTLTQRADSIELKVAAKNAVFRQEDAPDSYVKGDIWIKPSDGTAQIVDIVSDALVWRELRPSELKTSSIEIAQDHIDISTGGKLNVNSGAAHFRTAEYTLAILADDGSEDTVMDFDADSKTLRVDSIEAGNVRPFISGTTEVTSDQIGGLDGLMGMLESAQYEHIIYTQTSDDLSSEIMVISGSNSLNVKIKGAGSSPVQIPPVQFFGIVGNVTLDNLKWSTSEMAVVADSGNIVFDNCYIDSNIGMYAEYNARMIWIGMGTDTAGACSSKVALATRGAEIRLYGLIPAGDFSEVMGGTVTAIDTRSGAGGAVTEATTDVINATVGYYGSRNGWNDGQLYQGYSDGKGRIYGCMRFDGLPAAGTTVKSALLGLHRYKGAGKGSEVDVSVYGSAAAFGSTPSLGTCYVSREDAADPGETISLDVTAAAQALVNGTIAQLVLYTGETTTMSGKVYSSQYALFDKAALKITY